MKKDDFSYARTGLYQLDGRIRDGGERHGRADGHRTGAVGRCDRAASVCRERQGDAARQLHDRERHAHGAGSRAAEALGFKVIWNNGEVNINDGEMQCDLRIGEENYFVYTAIKDAIGMSAPFTRLRAGAQRTTRPMYRSVSLVPLFGNNDAAVQITDTTVTIDKDAESGDSTETPQLPTSMRTSLRSKRRSAF